MAETKTKSGGKRRSTTSRSASPRGNGASASGSKARVKAAAEEQVGSVREIATGKGPALAGGAAVLAGVAGAVVFALNGRGKNRSLPDAIKKRRRKATRKALGSTTKALGKTTVAVGKAGYRVGELTAEVRRVREQASQKN
jgi:hypothetical protein